MARKQTVHLTQLSAADLAAIRGLFAAELGRVRNTTGRPAPALDDYPTASDCYIARTPAAGIPAIVGEFSYTGTGTGSCIPGWAGTGTGTGTGTWATDDDQPGYADCQVYRIIERCGVPVVDHVSGLVKRVYNLSTSDIPGDTWIIAERDKWGSWLALQPSGGSSALSGALVQVESQEVQTVTTTLVEWTYSPGGDYQYDTDSYYDPATKAMTIPADGYYRIRVGMGWAAQATHAQAIAGTYRTVGVWINGTVSFAPVPAAASTIIPSDYTVAGIHGPLHVLTMPPLYLLSGDLVYVGVRQDSGIFNYCGNYYPGSGFSPVLNAFFEIQKVGS
jgi:hypothetical protein